MFLAILRTLSELIWQNFIVCWLRACSYLDSLKEQNSYNVLTEKVGNIDVFGSLGKKNPTLQILIRKRNVAMRVFPKVMPSILLR